jgi:hypothetical protein
MTLDDVCELLRGFESVYHIDDHPRNSGMGCSYCDDEHSSYDEIVHDPSCPTQKLGEAIKYITYIAAIRKNLLDNLQGDLEKLTRDQAVVKLLMIRTLLDQGFRT